MREVVVQGLDKKLYRHVYKFANNFINRTETTYIT